MNFILTKHAQNRLKERGISNKLLKETLQKPTKISYDREGKILFKKSYIKEGRNRLLLAVAEINKDKLRIITVIDTSKIKKYL